MEFISNTKGHQKLVYEGSVYLKQKYLANRVVLYECEKRRNKSKSEVLSEEVLERTNEHTHASSIAPPKP